MMKCWSWRLLWATRLVMISLSRVRLRLLLAIAAGGSVVTSASAAVTVDFIAQPGQRFVADANGEPVRIGTVQVGTFAADFDPTAAGVSPTQLQAAWIEFGRSEIRAIAGQQGRFSDSVSADGSAVGGRQIYVWISAGVVPSADQAFAIFSSDDSGWRFPTEGAPPPFNSTLISSDEVKQVIGSGTITAMGLQLDGFIGGSPYDSWVDAEFPPGSDEAVTAQTVDADFDGWSNAFEFLMGTGPLDLRGFPVVEAAVSGDTTELVFPIGPAAATSDFRYQVSNNLIDWTTVEPSNVELIEASRLVRVTFFRPDSERLRFYRMVSGL